MRRSVSLLSLVALGVLSGEAAAYVAPTEATGGPPAGVLEVKAGPYEPQLDKEFASWAPSENDPAIATFVSWLETATPGERVR